MTDGGATVKKILPPIAGDVRCNVRSLSQEDPLEEGYYVLKYSIISNFLNGFTYLFYCDGHLGSFQFELL